MTYHFLCKQQDILTTKSTKIVLKGATGPSVEVEAQVEAIRMCYHLNDKKCSLCKGHGRGNGAKPSASRYQVRIASRFYDVYDLQYVEWNNRCFVRCSMIFYEKDETGRPCVVFEIEALKSEADAVLAQAA